MSEQNFYPIKLLEKRQLTKDVIELRFTRPSGFVFEAGQFVQFKIPDGEEFVARSYSISSQLKNDYLEFLVKIIPNGKGSVYFTDLSAGQEAQITKAKGVFVVKSEHKPKKIFVATGVGLAPIMSMLENAFASTPVLAGGISGPVAKSGVILSLSGMVSAHSPRPPAAKQSLHLLFGVRTQADIFWGARMAEIKDRNPSFSYDICLSRETAPSFFTGRVSAKLPEVLTIEAEYYICGSLEMVKDIRTILVTQGVLMKQLHFEIF